MSGEEEIIEVTVDMGELKKMKVPELKKKVAELGLPTKGTKAELLARVEKYVHEQEEEEELLEEEEGGEEEAGEEVEEEEEEEEEGTYQRPKLPMQQRIAQWNQKKTEEKKEITPATTIKKATVSVSNLATGQAERLAQRTAKFGGSTSEEAKKMARAERFGTANDNGYQGLGKRGTPTEEELEKFKKRAERFGSSVSPAITAVEEDEKKKKRLARFGQAATELSVQERKKLRADRFGAS